MLPEPTHIANTQTSYRGVVLSAMMLAIVSVSYYNFASFYPKALSQVREVQGLRTDSQHLPVPYDAEKISEYNTNDGYVLTIKTSKPINEIESFFQNALAAKAWRIDNYSESDAIKKMKFKKEAQTLYITMTTQDAQNTSNIVTLEVID